MATSTEQDKAAWSSEESGDNVSDAHANSPALTTPMEIGMAHMRIRARMRESDPAMTERVLCDICDTPKDAFSYCEECKANLCPPCFQRHWRSYKNDNKEKATSSSEESGDDVSDAHANSPALTSIEIGMANMRIRARMRESDPAMTERVLCDICDTPKDAFLFCEECKVNLCPPCFQRHGQNYYGDNSHHLSVPCCLNKAEALAQLPKVETELVQLYQEEESLQWKGRQLEKLEVGLRRERDAYVNSARRQLRNRLVAIEKERKDLQKKHAELKQICQTPAEQLWKHSGVSANVLDDYDVRTICSRRPATAVFEHRMEEHATRTLQRTISVATGTVVYRPKMSETNRQVTAGTTIPWPHSHPGSSTVQGTYPPEGSVVTSLPQTVPVDLTQLAHSLRHLQHSVSFLQQTTTRLHAKVSDLEDRHVRLVHEVSKLQESNDPLITCLSAMQDGQDGLHGAVAIMALQNEHLVAEIVSVKEENARLAQGLAQLKEDVSRMENNVSDAGQECGENDVAHHLEQDVEDGERETETNAGQRAEGHDHDLPVSADQPEQTS